MYVSFRNIHFFDLYSIVAFYLLVATCSVSEQLLKRYARELGVSLKPLLTEGDGNCLFRAASLSFYGTDNYHLLLRLLSLCEVVRNIDFYNSKRYTYIDTMLHLILILIDGYLHVNDEYI